MRFNTTKRQHKKFEPRVRVSKLKEELTCEEYKSMVRDKVEEEEWKYHDVNEHWHKMKKIMMETAQRVFDELSVAKSCKTGDKAAKIAQSSSQG